MSLAALDLGDVLDTIPAPPPRDALLVSLVAGLDPEAVSRGLDARGLAAVRVVLDRCHCPFCVASRGRPQ